MQRRTKTAETFEIAIDKLVFGGDGFGRHEGKVVFVPYSAPGDRLIVRPLEEKKNFVRAEIVQILQPGPGRVAPQCPHFQQCGGCQWQHLNYTTQVEAKRTILEEAFHHRFPETRSIPVSMEGSVQPYGYRSRARMQLRGSGPNAVVGFFRAGAHTVEDVESCPLFRRSLNEGLGALRHARSKLDGAAHSSETDIACSEEENKWAIRQVGPDHADSRVHHLAPLASDASAAFNTFKTLTTLNDEAILHRTIDGFVFSVTASAFFQANDFMVEELTRIVRRAAEDRGSGAALDLFCGAGLFTLPLARQFSKVLAVENSPLASRLCSINAENAGLRNVRVACADVLNWMAEGEDRGTEFELVVLDPPRSGAGIDIMKRLGEMASRTIIYVSCDPQTLIRDLAIITPTLYTIDSVAGMDMFPQTYHFETVVRLTRKR